MKLIPTVLLFCAGFVVASCLNPIGFTSDLSASLDDGTDLITGGPNQAGDTSPTDDPDPHPDPDKGTIIFKNLTGGQKAMAATFTITGQESAINTAIPLGSGQEKSIILLPGTYNVVITFAGEGSPISGSKVLLAGRVEYVYFYVGKDGSYKGGINVDSSIVYGDIDLNFYQDNENAGENTDSNSAARPEEGDVSRDNDPRGKLPSAMRENYGIAIVHNLSKSMPLLKVVFDHYANNNEAGGVFDTHWEMNPGPDKGNRKSIILQPGLWKARAIWIDPNDPSCGGGVISTSIIKAGIGNYVNHLYFYKSTDGKYYLTDKSDSTQWSPPFDNSDYLANGSGGGETKDGEGQITNEGGTIDTGNSWWDANRNSYGILQVKNLSSRVAVTKVEFESGGKKYEMGRISPHGDRSIVLATGAWQAKVHYTVSSTTSQKTAAITIYPVGLTGRLNYLYFYYTGSDYDVSGGETPPDYQNDSGGGSSSPGYAEGDSPGALNDTNRDKLGLLILRNLSPDLAVDYADFTKSPGSFSMNPGPAVKDQKSILLGSGDWQVKVYYTINASASAGPKTATIVAGQVTYMYFYKTRTGGYAISPSWPPNPDDSASDNADPGTIIGDDEGWLNIINNSASAIIDRVQYNNGGTWIDIAIPTASGTIAPGNESDPDLVVLKGSWSFRFKTLLKQTYSRSVSKTIRAGHTVDITYTDALDADEPPDGYGTLRIVNDSSSSVYRVKYTNLTQSGAEYAVDISIPQGQNQSLILPAPASGSPPFYTYLVKCYISSGGAARYVQNQVEIRNQQISTITITNDTPTVVESGADNQGHIRVYNNYDNYEVRRTSGTLRPTLPVKFFIVGLKGVGNMAGTNVVDGSSSSTGDPASLAPSGSLNLRTGSFTQLDVAQEGQYELWIVWGNTIAGDTASLFRTKYGTYDIAKNTLQDIYIDFYSLNTAESLAVSMRITHVGYPSAAGINQIQIWYGGSDANYDDPGEGRIPARANGSTNDTYVVYKNNDILYAGDYREFKLVPGKKYWARVYWPLWNNWVGTGGFNQDFTLVQLAANATTGHLQFVFDDTSDMLKFFSDQASGIKLQTIAAAKSLLYRPGAADPGNESNPSNFYGLKSVIRNEFNNYIEGIDITPYKDTYPVVYAENRYFNATIHWYKRAGTVSTGNVGWGPPVELSHTGSWADSSVVYMDKFETTGTGTTNPAGWYYAEVILSPKQGYDISEIPANSGSSQFFQYDDYALTINDPLVLTPATSDSNTGGDRSKGRIYSGAPGANSGMTAVAVSGNQIKVRLWFREAQNYPNPSGTSDPAGYPQYP
ncbi:MAG: hypothetical protein LBG07_06865 [Treponema sp.]|jgi:hypothetical protein|nr:hypothetical protein [Treponema sp.]